MKNISLKILAITFCWLPNSDASIFCQNPQILQSDLNRINGRWCINRIQSQPQNPQDSSGLANACFNASVIANSMFYLCPNGCFQIKKTKLVEGKESVVEYRILTESGFWVASFDVNIRHHEKSFVSTFRNPQKVAIALPQDGSIELGMWEALFRLQVF